MIGGSNERCGGSVFGGRSPTVRLLSGERDRKADLPFGPVPASSGRSALWPFRPFTLFDALPDSRRSFRSGVGLAVDTSLARSSLRASHSRLTE
jgi:hypothetical protein